MILENLKTGAYETNCYLVACEETKEGIVIDPGFEGEIINKRIDELGLKIKAIVLTHGHLDHISAVKDVKKHTKADIMIHENDYEMLTDSNQNLSKLTGKEVVQPKADKKLNDNDKIEVGRLVFDVVHTPGHTEGGISLVIENTIFSGDTLFAGSIGRTDLPGGNFNQIINSIKTKLLVFDDKTVVYPGHGPSTTIEMEKRINPFIK